MRTFASDSTKESVALIMKDKNRQEVVCDYIYDNYVQFSRLRRDLISNKVQNRKSAHEYVSFIRPKLPQVAFLVKEV